MKIVVREYKGWGTFRVQRRGGKNVRSKKGGEGERESGEREKFKCKENRIE